MRNLILLSLITAAAASAQAVSVGILAGAPLNSVISSKNISGIQYDPKSLHFTLGGAFQLDLPFRLRFEIDALYRPAKFTASNIAGQISAANFKFPVMMKYRFRDPLLGGRLEPFAGVGFSFDHMYQVTNAVRSGIGSVATNSPAGVLLVGGFDFKALGNKLSAEMRYTRQRGDTILGLTQLNQADLLVGIHF